jgi:uncharacterized membrane protein
VNVFKLSLTTAIVLLAADAIVIPVVMRPLFLTHLGLLMLDSLRLVPAVLFYAIHIFGLVFLAGLPALRAGRPKIALINGAVLGLVAYSCYEMTSWTIMRDWHINLVLVDVAWGTFISGVSAYWGARIAIGNSSGKDVG